MTSHQNSIAYGNPQSTQYLQISSNKRLSGESGPGNASFRSSHSYIKTIEHSKVSIKDSTSYQNTNNLYRPLKETLYHPEIIQRHQQFTPQVVQGSYVTKDYRLLNERQLHRLKDNIMIPDAELEATHNLEKVRGMKFYAVDATQKIGKPVSQQQLNRIRSQGFKKEEVVYEVIEPQCEVIVIQKQAERDSYRPPRFEEYYKQPEYKYNLFSCIDQPANICRTEGCGTCHRCPGNEVIARHNYPPSVIRSSNGK